MSSYMQVWVGGWQKNTRRPFLSVLNPHLSTNSPVLCGSCSGHKDKLVLLGAFRGKDVDVDLKINPPKTPKYAQPLNVYSFKQYKLYSKRITDFIKLRSSNMQPKFHDRFFVMKLHSVIYNQLSAEAYRPRVRKSRYWGEMLLSPIPCCDVTKPPYLLSGELCTSPLHCNRLYVYTVCCRRGGQCFSVLITRHTDVVGDSSGRSYVTEQGHNVPLLRSRDIDQCFVTYGRKLATILVNLWTTSQVSLTWPSAVIL